jgi:predicted peptidase
MKLEVDSGQNFNSKEACSTGYIRTTQPHRASCSAPLGWWGVVNTKRYPKSTQEREIIMTITSSSFNDTINIEANIGYKLFVPNNYDPSRRWPIILFLHGIKKRGSDLSLLDNYGLLKTAESTSDFEFIVVAPQCPAYSFWPSMRHEVLALLNQVMSNYNVDNNKVYLTGFSMGGNGVWDLATHYSKQFSAIVPLAGWYEKEAVKHIQSPVWVFHGEEDDKVPISNSIELVNQLKGTDTEIQFTTYPGLSHSIMDETYSNPELFKWLLRKERGSNENNNDLHG